MTETKRKKSTTAQSGKTKDKRLTRVQQHLAAFDKRLGEAFIEVDNRKVDPELILIIAARHVTEYGCWAFNGNAPLVAATMLGAIADHLAKYESCDLETDDIEKMEIEIVSDWGTGTNGKAETRQLMLAMQEHLCRWMALSFDETHAIDETFH